MSSKTSPTMDDALGNLMAVTSTGDLRRIVANAMLAHSRGELANSNLDALSKGLDSISNSLQAEVKIAKLRREMHVQGGNLGKFDKDAELGTLRIGS